MKLRLIFPSHPHTCCLLPTFQPFFPHPRPRCWRSSSRVDKVDDEQVKRLDLCQCWQTPIPHTFFSENMPFLYFPNRFRSTNHKALPLRWVRFSHSGKSFVLENVSPAHLRGDVICDFATLFSAIRSGSGKSGSIGLGPLFLWRKARWWCW